MSLEAKFIPAQKPDTHLPLVPDIEPGQAGLWLDKSFQTSRYIIARCCYPNIGAQIYIEDEDAIEYDGKRLNFLREAEPIEILPIGHKFEIDIIDADDESGRLVIQHIGYSGLINSLN